jgi:hypothetical protein
MVAGHAVDVALLIIMLLEMSVKAGYQACRREKYRV